MKTLGIIGGTSYHSSLEYYRLINQMVTESIGKEANPELILYSINIALMRSQDKKSIIAKYLEVSRKLEDAGAQAILIAANTPHLVYPHISAKVNIPFLHIGEAIGRSAQQLNAKKVGLLGNRPTMTGSFIPDYLFQHFALETIIPEATYLDTAHHFVSKELTQGIYSPRAKYFFLHQMELLVKKGAEAIILGCTELPLLLDNLDPSLPVIPTTSIHARLAADFILDKVQLSTLDPADMRILNN